MYKLYPITLLLTLTLLTACNTAKDTSDSTKDNKNKMSKQEYLKNGFVSGKFVNSTTKKEGACTTYIQLSSNGELLDPIDNKEEYKEYYNTNIWLKFSSLRMKNRCEEARPITILDIKKRAE